MKIKPGYIMKKVGSGFVVVTVGQASLDFNGMIRLNKAGAFLWEQIKNGADSEAALVAAMQQRYDDLDEATAKADLAEFLQTVSFAMEE